MGIKLLPPRSTRVREQDVDMIRMLPNFLHKSLNLADFGAIGRNRDRNGAWGLVGQSIEGFACLFAGFGFARGDEYFGAPCLKET